MVVGGSGVLLTGMPRPAQEGPEGRQYRRAWCHELVMGWLWVSYGLAMGWFVHLRQAVRTCSARGKCDVRFEKRV